MLNILVIREMQIKTTVRYYFTSTRMAIILNNKNKEKITSVDKDVEKLKPLYDAVGNVKMYSHCGKSLAVPQKAKHGITT